MIYHLGEIVRLERQLPRNVPAVTIFPERVTYFSARPREVCPSDCTVWVEYCGCVLSVSPRPEDGESMHVLSLLSQLLAMHKSADELPKGGVVTLVGN
jgi:hypothetical protein